MINKKAIYLLFTANTISGFAQGISMIAIPWYIINIFAKASFFGVLYGIVTFFTLFWGLYVGTLIDKYNRHKIFLLLSIVGGLILLTSSLTGYYTGSIHLFLVAMVFVSTYFIFTVYYPNLYAFAQEITERKNYGKITSYIEIQGQLTSMISGGIAAVLLSGTVKGETNMIGFMIEFPFEINKWELHEIFLMDAITYFIAFILILFLKYKPVAKRETETGNVWYRLKAGLNYLKRNPLLFIFGNTSYAIFITILVIIFFLTPVYINNHLKAGAGVYAVSDMCFAIGAVIAGVGISWIFKKVAPVMGIIVMIAITAFIYFFYIFNTIILLFYLTYFLLGLCNSGTRIMRITYLFNHIPNDIIGRAGSIFNMINTLFRLLFIWLFSIPFFFEADNIVYAYMILGAFLFLSMIPLIYKYRALVK
ncbi:MAG: MFS transporter [Bacteroidota bacterium]